MGLRTGLGTGTKLGRRVEGQMEPERLLCENRDR